MLPSMMKSKGQVSLFLAVGLAIITLPTVAMANQNRVAEGSLRLKRQGWSNFSTVGVGTLLNSGDQLQASQGVKAAVSCAGSPPLRVPPTQIYPVSYFCGNSNRTPLRQREQIDSFPGGNDSTIPYIITPRRGGLLDDTPTLRWNPISGVTRYTVRVVGSGVNWESEISGSEVVYSGEQVLQPGKVYSVIVEADNGTSSQWDEGVTDSGFKLVYPDVAERVRTKINDIAQSELSPEAQALAMADLYFEEDLVSEAIATLEPLVKAGSTTVQVYQMLGDLYRYSGLNLLAKERYEEAIALAASEDIEGQAAAQVGLAEVMAMLGNPSEAVKLLEEAQVNYQQLGDSERVEALQQRSLMLANSNNQSR